LLDNIYKSYIHIKTLSGNYLKFSKFWADANSRCTTCLKKNGLYTLLEG